MSKPTTTQPDHMDATSVSTAVHVMLREYGLSDGTDHEACEDEDFVDGATPRRTNAATIISYCAAQDRRVTPADAKVVAKIVNEALSAFHAKKSAR
jgi:hypothetical protein